MTLNSIRRADAVRYMSVISGPVEYVTLKHGYPRQRFQRVVDPTCLDLLPGQNGISERNTKAEDGRTASGNPALVQPPC